MSATSLQTPSLTRYAWISIAAAIATILLKTVAWKMTGSVGLLSDAIESVVNLAGALMALWMLTLAALSIGYTAIDRLLNPQPLEAVGVGLVVSVLASVINFATARCLMKAGRKHNSITLEADAHHLMTDVWTSVGVIAGVGLVALTGWLWLDAAVAMLVAANIVWTGYQLMRRSADGLMDISLPPEKLEQIETLLAGYRQQGLDFDALRTRQAGSHAFVTLHVLVPGHWTVSEGHDWAERIEVDIRNTLTHTDVTTHLEPLEAAA